MDVKHRTRITVHAPCTSGYHTNNSGTEEQKQKQALPVLLTARRGQTEDNASPCSPGASACLRLSKAHGVPRRSPETRAHGPSHGPLSPTRDPDSLTKVSGPKAESAAVTSFYVCVHSAVCLIRRSADTHSYGIAVCASL